MSLIQDLALQGYMKVWDKFWEVQTTRSSVGQENAVPTAKAKSTAQARTKQDDSGAAKAKSPAVATPKK